MAISDDRSKTTVDTPSPMDQRLKELGFTTWLITLAGSTTLTGFLATLFQGPGAADLESVTIFISAALGGLALTVGMALGWAALARGEFQGHSAGIVATLAMLAGIGVANVIGIGTVGTDALIAANSEITSSAPIAQALKLVLACVYVYGIVSSIQAALAGRLLGHWLNLLRPD